MWHMFSRKNPNSNSSNIFQPINHTCPKLFWKQLTFPFPFRTIQRQKQDSEKTVWIFIWNILKEAKIEIKSYLLDRTMKCSSQLWQKNSKLLGMASGLSLVRNFSIQSSFHQLTGNKKVHIFSEHHKIWKQSPNFIWHLFKYIPDLHK